MRRLHLTAVVTVVVTAGSAAGVSGQAAAGAEPRFDVASVKTAPSPFAAAPGGGAFAMPFGVRVQPGGRLIAMANLRTLILTSYHLEGYQLEGVQPWFTTDYFDISAKAERETATEADLHAMLRSLLAERFGLRVHVETRQAPVFALTARADGRLGAGLKRTSAECERDLEERKRTGAAPPPISRPAGGLPPRLTPMCGMTSAMITPAGVESWAMGGRPFADLVGQLSTELKAPVVDRTGLDGLFDAVIEYESLRRPPRGLDPNSTDPLPVPLPAAVQQQLGLTLEKGTGPLRITIVDAAEHPTPN